MVDPGPALAGPQNPPRRCQIVPLAAYVVLVEGRIGYWAWDNAVLSATYHAFGPHVRPLSIVLMGYLIGQLGGLLPLPGGISRGSTAG